jgi:voltage-gated potassium channel
LGTVIWIIFIADFLLRFAVAPRKLVFLKKGWLTAVSLALPALRAARLVRLMRATRVAQSARGIRLVRVVGSLNRGMRALGNAMSRRGFGYVVTLTVLVTFAGAAGMHSFERDVPGAAPLQTFTSSIWWTAMIMTTMGSDYWPQTTEGRILALLLAVYAFTVFGYVTAALASYFVGRDAEDAEAEVAGDTSINRLREEIAVLRAELQSFRRE